MTDLKNVLANRLVRRLKVRRSQMIQLPSLLALTHSSSSFLMRIAFTDPLWSFMLASSTCAVLPIFHTRTMPSSPPLITLLLSDVDAMAVTALWCASWMVYSSLPLCGANARILPSLQPLTMLLPSCGAHGHSSERREAQALPRTATCSFMPDITHITSTAAPDSMPAAQSLLLPRHSSPLTVAKMMQWHSRLGTAIRSSSRHVARCHTRM